MIGLDEKQKQIVLNIVRKYPAITFYAYGSRVKGNFVKSSDLDILIKSKNQIADFLLDEINNAFYSSRLPFIVNVKNEADLDEKFLNSIEPDLVLIN